MENQTIVLSSYAKECTAAIKDIAEKIFIIKDIAATAIIDTFGADGINISNNGITLAKEIGEKLTVAVEHSIDNAAVVAVVVDENGDKRNILAKVEISAVTNDAYTETVKRVADPKLKENITKFMTALSDIDVDNLPTPTEAPVEAAGNNEVSETASDGTPVEVVPTPEA